MLRIKKKIQMHIAQRKELDVHKTKQKRDRNRTTTSLVLDSSMQRGRWEFRLNQRIWLRLSSVFESRRISFLKIFLVSVVCCFKYSVKLSSVCVLLLSVCVDLLQVPGFTALAYV